MKKILLLNDGNAIAKSIETLCINKKFSVETYRESVAGFSIIDILANSSDFFKKLKRQKYDAMLIAPMYFEYDGDNFQKMLEMNVLFPDMLMKQAESLMQAGGTIINLISADYVWGSYMSKYYSAVMAAKVSLTKSYANTLGPKNIRVNSVAAAWIAGVVEDSLDASVFSTKVAEGIDQKAKEMTPLGRKGLSEEVAQIVMFLLSSEAAFIHGQTINADGGYGNVDPVTKYEYELNTLK